jgi:hypothetical protein
MLVVLYEEAFALALSDVPIIIVHLGEDVMEIGNGHAAPTAYMALAVPLVGRQ